MADTKEIKAKKDPNDFYDRMFKRVLTLSSKAVIGFINGAFGTDYTEDSNITYKWTEFVDDKQIRPSKFGGAFN